MDRDYQRQRKGYTHLQLMCNGFQHMLEHAREAVGMIGGKAPEDLGKERMFELALVRLVEIIG